MPHRTNREPLDERDGVGGELVELREYREQRERTRGDLSLLLLEYEQAHQRFGLLLERLRRLLLA